MKKETNSFKNPHDALKELNANSFDTYKSNDFTINDCGELNYTMPFVTMNYRMDFFCFVFAKRASGSFTTVDLKFDIHPGTVYFINPGHLSNNIWISMDELYLITFTEDYLKKNVHPDVFNEFPFLLSEIVNPITFKEDVFKEFENIYLQMHYESKTDSIFKDKIIGSLLVVLLLKIKDLFWKDYNPVYEGNKSSQIVKSFKINLETHIRDLVAKKTDKQFRVSDFASMQNLNESYLNSVIKSKTGKTVSSWISEKIIAESKSMLHNSTASIKEIAYNLGFLETAHFSTYFKKHTNCTPADFRNAN